MSTSTEKKVKMVDMVAVLVGIGYSTTNAPAMAIGKPQAADVPTAFCITTPFAVKYGTVILPPPMPKMADATPMPEPAAICLAVDGSVLFGSTGFFAPINMV